MSELGHSGEPAEGAAVALLLIDIINDLDFPDAEELLGYAKPMAARIADLKRRAEIEGIPTIYVNDNFGHWRSDLQAQVKHAMSSPGKSITAMLQPGDDDYFVLKPMHSGFHGTALELLLKHLGVTRLILCGMATNICVLFTASDAYMRGYELWVPSDCVAANSEMLNHNALEQIRTVLKADIRASGERSLDDWDRAGVVRRDRLIHPESKVPSENIVHNRSARLQPQ